ncbi:HDOD domain-containing protein [Piscinibacter sp. XHJ-5]|uniref:HDOD domain-containing protein n=1 Tax=Piscinibacter sp. XHJ-5 TaxID=3037797 RepID=UPI00245297C5|nr:HDOD domain-containing protein [Piscinibacter sp. XHJ-5]
METIRLTQPLRDLAAWTACFQAAEIPVLSSTAQAVEELRLNEDAVDANLIGETVAGDPLMTLRLLAHAAANRPPRMLTEPETVTAAVVMMGIAPFFRAFGPLPTVEDRLHDQPEALQGLRDVLRRAHRAANFALGFSVHRMDHDAAVIHHAALLHDFAELLLWCHGPELALRIRRAQEADPTLRSSSIQRTVLNITISELQQALMRAWRLPEQLVRFSDDRHVEHPSARSVMLAIRFARHTSRGWDNAALPDDVRDIAQLLNLSEAAAWQVLRQLDS